ncbi:ABC transporter permease subunit [Nocardioides perillae]|uniref:Osmoprotectant transport system permease protein n=1 Tax=Nocardioides perillae TaxID=1119534 RepID=A0A7Y9ULU2_9ACTN|nr:osmoprotectant transport system permease protein [Nocardioides perillae]
MSATTTAPSAAGPAPAPAAPDAGPGPSPGRRRLDRETRLLLVLPPLLVAAGFGAFALWRQSADLDSVEQSALAWRAITTATWEHVRITAAVGVAVVVTAVPLGILVTRPRFRRAAPLVVGVANAGQAAPSIGLVVLLAIWLGFGFWTGVLAVALYGLLPVLRNTITGLEGVDRTLVEAGRGMGMSPLAVLARVELPLALPVVMAGIRTSLVLAVGTATLVTFIAAGGLGGLITTGVNLFRPELTVAGAVLVALLALLVEWLGRLAEVLLSPRGL